MRGLLLPYDGHLPKVHESVFVAPGALIIGQAEIGERSSIWYNCVLRADENIIRIGRRANIQDGTVIHIDRKIPTLIGDDVVVGHLAVIHACTLEDGAFVGMKACVMDGAVVEGGAMVAAGALVTPGKRVPRGQLWAGSPAKYMRDLKPEELAHMTDSAERYVRYAARHMECCAGV